MIEINYGLTSIDDFIEKLSKYTLDPTFEKYGNFVRKNPKFPKSKELTKKYEGWWSFFGNFFDYSNAFSFYTDDAELVEKLTDLIRKNQSFEKYINFKKELEEDERKYKERLQKRLSGIW